MHDQQTIRACSEKFLDSMAEGDSPALTAQRLGIPVTTARTWAHRLTQLVSDLRGTQGLRPREICKGPLPTGITLVHTADTVEASPGQRVTFTAWVMNDTEEPLSEISLIPRSFTNAGMENLSYATQPPAPARCLAKLPPGKTARWTFTYLVTEWDLSHGGELLSAMGVQARNPAAATLWDECDAEVFLTPSNAKRSH